MIESHALKSQCNDWILIKKSISNTWIRLFVIIIPTCERRIYELMVIDGDEIDPSKKKRRKNELFG